MKVITIAIMVLRLGVLLALIMGILFWTGYIQNLIPIHMLIGILVVLSLWIIGLAQGFIKGASFSLALVTFILGLALAIVGLYQTGWLIGSLYSLHWIIRVIHLLLGLSAIALGEMIAARTKRRLKSTAQVNVS